MHNQAYMHGFCVKCAEFGVEPGELLKRAFVLGELAGLAALPAAAVGGGLLAGDSDRESRSRFASPTGAGVVGGTAAGLAASGAPTAVTGIAGDMASRARESAKYLAKYPEHLAQLGRRHITLLKGVKKWRGRGGEFSGDLMQGAQEQFAGNKAAFKVIAEKLRALRASKIKEPSRLIQWLARRNPGQGTALGLGIPAALAAGYGIKRLLTRDKQHNDS